MKAGDRLKLLSVGASGITAAARLKKIGGAASTAGALLVAYSGLASATAAVHLFVDRAQESSYYGAGADAGDADLVARNNTAAINIVLAIVASEEF
jgi:hypothetical protein